MHVFCRQSNCGIKYFAGSKNLLAVVSSFYFISMIMYQVYDYVTKYNHLVSQWLCYVWTFGVEYDSKISLPKGVITKLFICVLCLLFIAIYLMICFLLLPFPMIMFSNIIVKCNIRQKNVDSQLKVFKATFRKFKFWNDCRSDYFQRLFNCLYP